MPKDPVDKNRINEVVDEIKEKFGEGMIMKLGDVRKVDVEAVSTGSVSREGVTPPCPNHEVHSIRRATY